MILGNGGIGMTVTFCGHSEVYQSDIIRRWLISEVDAAIQDGAETFLLGGYGAFDAMAAGVVREAKSLHPNIEPVLVLPYLDKKVDTSQYDCTTYPPLERVPRRFAIVKRNQWCVDQSDRLIAYVTHDWGGAASTMAYAQRKGKDIRLYQPG